MQQFEPTPKDPEIDKLLSGISYPPGKDRITTIREYLCMTCDRGLLCRRCNHSVEHHAVVTGFPHQFQPFTDDLSAREYTISGMCQRCQDSVFGVEEGDT